MSPVDLAWLRMERPTNLMMIVGVHLYGGPVDLDRLERQLGERLAVHSRFRQCVEFVSGGAYWREDPHFNLAHHFRRVRLSGGGGKAALQRLVGKLAATSLDADHPLWQIHIVENYEDGAAAIFRVHHAVGDGVALTGVTMSLTDDAPPAPPASEDDDEASWVQSLVAPFAAAWESGAKASGFTVKHALEIAKSPSLAVDYLKVGGEIAAELAYLLLMPVDSATRFKGKPRGVKRVAWSEPLRLEDVKAVARAMDCSINDILLSCVAGAMRRYLVEKGDEVDGVELRAMVPINLRPPGPQNSLGNHFGVLVLVLPVGMSDPLERLAEIRARMWALKNSIEPPVTLGLIGALGYTPKYVQDMIFDLLISRCSAVMTNVPGLDHVITIAGSPLKQMMFWVPQSGETGVGVSILSYAGQVQFGLVTDAALIPDPEEVISRFEPEFEGYLYYCLLGLPRGANAAGAA
jgi:WS/DGAT/MGAT family acyltransferase